MIYFVDVRFGQDLSLWQSALVKQSNKLSTARAPYSVPTMYHPIDPMTDPMTQTIRPHLIQHQMPSFKPLHREGEYVLMS